MSDIQYKTMEKIDLSALDNEALLGLYSELMEELQIRGITHSTNNPVGNLAERLVTQALNLDRLPESTKGHDVIDGTGKKYEIKGRRPTKTNRSRQLSFLRELDKKHFDFLVGVLFHENMKVHKACLLPHSVVLSNSKYSKHGNAWIFHLRDDLWSLPDVVDITEALKHVENG